MALSPQRPLWRARQQDAAQVTPYLDEDFPKLAARAAHEGGDIWFADEAGVRSDSHAGTTWAPQGQTPIVPTTGARFRINLVSAISRQGELRFMVGHGPMNAELFRDFLKRLVATSDHKVFLIVDGHPVHKAKKVRNYVADHPEEMELHYLPPRIRPS
jgi:hypothetical protein